MCKAYDTNDPVSIVIPPTECCFGKTHEAEAVAGELSDMLKFEIVPGEYICNDML